jgi:tetratricopeptide (TPR) repeat protein
VFGRIECVVHRSVLQAQRCGPYGAAALKDFNQAVSLDRTSALCWNELGIAKRRLQQEGRGFAEFTTSISCDLRYVAALVNRAPHHAALGNSQLALYDYTRAIDIDHNNLTAYVNRGVLQYSLDRFAMAIVDFDQAIRLEPRCSVAWYNRGVCYQSLAKWDQAVQDYTKALASSPANFRVLRNRALAHLHGTKRADLARSDFLRALQQQPQSAELLCGLGLCEHRLENPREAIRYYTQALDCEQNCAAALLGRGNVYLQEIDGQTVANAKRLCMADYQRAIHLYPNFVPAHVNMALALHASKQDSRAWRTFSSALSLDPINPTALEGRAASSQVLENGFGAYLDISAAISMEPANARLLTTHGFIAQILNDVQVATQSYMKAANNDPSYGLAHYNLALMLRSRGDLSGAKEAYTKAIACGVSKDGSGKSKSGRAHYPTLNRGIVHMELGELPAALADFSAVIKSEPTSVAGYINRARAYASCAMWQEAEADYNEAVALTPLDADLYKERSDVCGAQHKAPDCLINYGTFLCLADGMLPAGTNENSTTEIVSRGAKGLKHPPPSRIQRRR